MRKKARELEAGDVVRMHICGEVVDVGAFTEGRKVLVRVRLALENQGGRRNCGAPVNHDPSGSELEFTGLAAIEFVCRGGRAFHIYDDDWYWNDDGDDDEPDSGPDDGDDDVQPDQPDDGEPDRHGLEPVV
jgi:hypothetical protein